MRPAFFQTGLSIIYDQVHVMEGGLLNKYGIMMVSFKDQLSQLQIDRVAKVLAERFYLPYLKGQSHQGKNMLKSTFVQYTAQARLR